MRTKNIIISILIVIILFQGIVYYEWNGKFSNRSHSAISGQVKKEDERWIQQYFDILMGRAESLNTNESEAVINRKSHESMDIIVEHKEIHNTTYTEVINTDTQRSRKDRVKYMCKAHPDIIQNNSSLYLHGLYYPKVPLYYCTVPKLGSTFLGAFFNQAFHYNGIRREEYVRTQRANKRIFSYLNVGEPYARLFSAYKDKLYRPDTQFWKKLGKDVVETVRNNTTTQDGGYDVTFTEFVQFVVNCHENGKVLNPHIEPIHKLCNPCKTRFNFIGKIETMSEDLVNLFNILNTAGVVKEKLSVPTKENTTRPHKVGKNSIMKLFHAVETCSHISVYNLFLRYWAMHQISGIVLNQYEMPFSESVAKSISPKEYHEALTSAVEKSNDNKEQLGLQRQEALVQAYRSVPLPLMLRLREFVKVDCLLFSYDDKPDLLFDRDTHNYNVTHVYMKGI